MADISAPASAGAPRFHFDRKIRLSDLLVLGGCVTTAVTGYFRIESRLDRLDDHVAANSTRIERIEARQERRDEQLQALLDKIMFERRAADR